MLMVATLVIIVTVVVAVALCVPAVAVTGGAVGVSRCVSSAASTVAAVLIVAGLCVVLLLLLLLLLRGHVPLAPLTIAVAIVVVLIMGSTAVLLLRVALLVPLIASALHIRTTTTTATKAALHRHEIAVPAVVIAVVIAVIVVVVVVGIGIRCRVVRRVRSHSSLRIVAAMRRLTDGGCAARNLLRRCCCGTIEIVVGTRSSEGGGGRQGRRVREPCAATGRSHSLNPTVWEVLLGTVETVVPFGTAVRTMRYKKPTHLLRRHGQCCRRRARSCRVGGRKGTVVRLRRLHILDRATIKVTELVAADTSHRRHQLRIVFEECVVEQNKRRENRVLADVIVMPSTKLSG